MSLRRRLVGSGVALLVTAAGVVVSAAPALADPPTPPGCVFDQSTGTTTCVTTTTGVTAPFTGSGDGADGSPGAFACSLHLPAQATLDSYNAVNVVLSTTTTTTTTYQGASPGKGNKPTTTATTTQYTGLVSLTKLACRVAH